MASGGNGDFHGGDVGAGGGGEPEPPVRELPPREATPHPAQPPPPSELPEEQLSVRPGFACDEGRLPGFFPSAAEDADLSDISISVEVLIDNGGHLVRAHARSDPGFGLAAAAERAAMSVCHASSIPRDADGRAVATRVRHTIHWTVDL
jgi:hypothetical protein